MCQAISVYQRLISVCLIIPSGGHHFEIELLELGVACVILTALLTEFCMYEPSWFTVDFLENPNSVSGPG